MASDLVAALADLCDEVWVMGRGGSEHEESGVRSQLIEHAEKRAHLGAKRRARGALDADTTVEQLIPVLDVNGQQDPWRRRFCRQCHSPTIRAYLGLY